MHWGSPSRMRETELRGNLERGVFEDLLRVPAGKGRSSEPWRIQWLWAIVASANTGADTREGPPTPALPERPTSVRLPSRWAGVPRHFPEHGANLGPTAFGHSIVCFLLSEHQDAVIFREDTASQDG